MLNPPQLSTLTEPITLEDFPDDDDYTCHACHGASEDCVCCQLQERATADYYRELMMERIADESR